MRVRMLGSGIAVFGLSIFLTACDATIDPAAKPGVEAFLNVPFSLSAGQTAVLAEQKLALTFVRVLDDSRCPVDTVCIQAGDATMSVQAEQEGKVAKALSLTLTDPPQGIVYEGFGIHALQLIPDQRSDRTIRPGEYRVRLLVDRP